MCAITCATLLSQHTPSSRPSHVESRSWHWRMQHTLHGWHAMQCTLGIQRQRAGDCVRKAERCPRDIKTVLYHILHPNPETGHLLMMCMWRRWAHAGHWTRSARTCQWRRCASTCRTCTKARTRCPQKFEGGPCAAMATMALYCLPGCAAAQVTLTTPEIKHAVSCPCTC